jgi:hypothetical protein
MTTRGVAAVVAALLLTGCGASQKPEPSAPTSAAPTQSTLDTAFLTRVRASVTGGADASLISAAHKACEQKHGGATDLDAASALVGEGFSTHDAATIVAAAAATYCK